MTSNNLFTNFLTKLKKQTYDIKERRKEYSLPDFFLYLFIYLFFSFIFNGSSILIGQEKNVSETVIIAQEELDDTDLGENGNLPTYLPRVMLINEEYGNLLKHDLERTTKTCEMLYHGAAMIKLYKESHYLYKSCNISCHN